MRERHTATHTREEGEIQGETLRDSEAGTHTDTHITERERQRLKH